MTKAGTIIHLTLLKLHLCVHKSNLVCFSTFLGQRMSLLGHFHKQPAHSYQVCWKSTDNTIFLAVCKIYNVHNNNYYQYYFSDKSNI